MGQEHSIVCVPGASKHCSRSASHQLTHVLLSNRWYSCYAVILFDVSVGLWDTFLLGKWIVRVLIVLRLRHDEAGIGACVGPWQILYGWMTPSKWSEIIACGLHERIVSWRWMYIARHQLQFVLHADKHVSVKHFRLGHILSILAVYRQIHNSIHRLICYLFMKWFFFAKRPINNRFFSFFDLKAPSEAHLNPASNPASNKNVSSRTTDSRDTCRIQSFKAWKVLINRENSARNQSDSALHPNYCLFVTETPTRITKT